MIQLVAAGKRFGERLLFEGADWQINPGDRVYAFGGAIDVTTGCLYGFSLNTNSNVGWYYGNSLDAIPAGQTATIRVRLKVGG